jgi:hypothetical protein
MSLTGLCSPFEGQTDPVKLFDIEPDLLAADSDWIHQGSDGRPSSYDMTDVCGHDLVRVEEESQTFLFENIDISSSEILMKAQSPLSTEDRAVERMETRKEIQRRASQKYRSKRKNEVVRLKERCKELERLLEVAVEEN